MSLGQEIGEAGFNLETGLIDYRERLENAKTNLLNSECTAEEFRRDMKMLTELISIVDDYLIAGDVFHERLIDILLDVGVLVEA